MNRTAADYESTVLDIVDGTKIVVPDSLDLITPYVLREQLDWFEAEIKFVRELLKPGDLVLDIGANYGLYTLAMAKIVGELGHVYAFEPATQTASYLQQSIAINQFNQVTLVRAAISNISGTANLGLNSNSELNSLNTSLGSGSVTERVPMTTLNIQALEWDWRGIKFIKLDAEGEEANILMGGSHFLKEESPLIMFELMHAEVVNSQLIHKFELLGFTLYRLVQGLNLLVPFTLNDAIDAYQLNLFGCKEDCADRLASDGMLVKGIFNQTNQWSNAVKWADWISSFPYGQYLKNKWQNPAQLSSNAECEIYLKILSSYASLSVVTSSEERYARLQQVYQELHELCDQHPTLPRLISLSRIAYEFSQREVTLISLRRAWTFINQGVNALTEPFLATNSRFEMLDPKGRISNWLVASILEQMEYLEFYSSYYSQQNTLPRLNAIRNTGFQSAEIDRRINLIHTRFGSLN